MAAIDGSGFDGGFFLLKGPFFSFSFHGRLVHTQDGGLDRSNVSVQSVGFFRLATFFLIGSVRIALIWN